MVEAAGIDLLNLLLVLTLAWAFGLLVERVGYPALMGEILAGILFGPALLGLVHPSEPLDIFAELGVFLLMIYVGMEVDIHDLFDLGPQALMVAVGGFVLPFGLGYAVGGVLGATIEQALFIGIAMAATSLATKSRILVDLDILDTRIAGVLLGGALLSDVGVMVVFTGIMGFVETGEVTALGLGLVAGKALLFFAVALVIGDKLLPYIWEQLEGWMTRHEFVDKTSAFTVALVVALIFAFLAALADLHMIIGGFIAGLFLRQAQLDPDIYDHMYNVMYDLAMGFFAPIFFVTVAFELTLTVFTQSLGLLVLIVVVAFVSKIAGSWLFTLPTKLSSKEGLVIGLGMNGRGTVEIVIVSIALSAGIIGQELFSILVFTAIFTTTLVPPTVKWGIDWLEQTDELVFIEDVDVEVE
ncbi:glutathione-regulated potassium-efflux system protein KefB [Halalkalicoccus paucihalophilus]|uniref:Glutathione-regulated potassium-efflux system protein KefB n=1 Tax=Halalkalicoccus paucihalophilus TaxID=1008153 RepID=A0A151A8P8_9EURY|nr:cation:proton antiporter [Halalkalicoccus paucihalophilus]KYH23757.1 glutathione-regulated potassium-efflux system protein KefB [Halalkalicoccus paucihalophilus]